MQARHAVVREVVHDAGVEADVAVDDQRGAQQGVEDRVRRAANEGRGGQRDERRGDEPLEGPVVAAGGGRGGWDWRGVVDVAADGLWEGWKEDSFGSGGLECS